MFFVGGSRINYGIQTPTKFGIKVQNQNILYQRVGVGQFGDKKQKHRDWGNVTATPNKEPSMMLKQPKIDNVDDAEKIKGADMKGSNIVVVGGGPAGLAAALMLAKHSYNNIKVLEALSEEEYFDTSRSYPYGINYRGQCCLEKLDVLEHLKEVGVDQQKVQSVVVSLDGTMKTMPTMFSRPKEYTTYLAYRQEISKILLDKIKNDYKNSVTIHFNAKCIELKQIKNKQLQLTYQIKNENPISISPYLVIGADGKNSFIRKSLHEITNKEKFELIQKPVNFTGTTVKVIQVPQKFYLDKNKQKLMENQKLYIIGVSKDQKNKMLMVSFWPSKSLTQSQSRTLVLSFFEQDHNLLNISDREEFFNTLEKYIPQVPIRDIITPEEADNSILKRGLKFPQGGYSQNLSYIIQEEKNNDKENNNNKTTKNNNFSQGVILIGDAIHHFPPYIGQGANAALEDVSILYDLFKKYDCNIEPIMHEYESTRIIDTKALLQFPQYTMIQPPTNWLIDNIYKIYMIVKFFLHKSIPIIFPPPPMNYLLRNELRYSEVIRLIDSSNQWYNVFTFMLLGVPLLTYLYLQLEK